MITLCELIRAGFRSRTVGKLAAVRVGSIVDETGIETAVVLLVCNVCLRRTGASTSFCSSRLSGEDVTDDAVVCSRTDLDVKTPGKSGSVDRVPIAIDPCDNLVSSIRLGRNRNAGSGD